MHHCTLYSCIVLGVATQQPRTHVYMYVHVLVNSSATRTNQERSKPLDVPTHAGRSFVYGADDRQRPAPAAEPEPEPEACASTSAPAPAQPVETTSVRRQEGQVELDTSQASTQAAWNPWPHAGSTRTVSPRANSARQMAHSGRSSSSPPSCSGRAHDTVGIESSAFRLIPLHAAAAARSASASTEKADGLHSREHRATKASPTTHSRKQSTAARIRNVSVCTPPAEGGAAAAASRCSTDCKRCRILLYRPGQVNGMV